LYRGVEDTLRTYVNVGYKFYILTKGDPIYQERKLAINKLHQFIQENGVYIVPKKTGKDILNIMHQHNLNPHETVMIGDSERDDIASAHDANIDSVLVATGTRWAYEDGHGNRPTFHLPSFADLPKIIPLPVNA
jgi:putative hydrolase of the HAD superfamily